MAEHAAQDPADDRARTLGCDGSTTCWRSTQQRCSGGPTTARTYDTGTSNSFSSGRHRYSYAGAGGGRRRHHVRILVTADLPHRRHTVVHVVLPERRVVARLQHDAAAAKARILADLPATALDDGRRRAIVETERREIRRRLADHERASAKASAS
jgi:hypothetical protein